MKKLAIALALLIAAAGVLVVADNTTKEIWHFHNVVAAAPYTCTPEHEGNTAFNNDKDLYIVCTGSAWYPFDSSGSPDGNPQIGSGAGDAQTTSSLGNAFGGLDAGALCTGACISNTSFGSESSPTLSTGDRNVAYGQGAGPANYSDTLTIGQEMTAKADYSFLIGMGAHDWIFSKGPDPVVLVDNTATAILDISVADDTTGGAVIIYTVTSAESDEYQSETGAVYISWENDSGTESCAIGEIGTTVLAGGSTMAVTNACTTGLTDEIRWTFTADSGLGAPATLLHLYYTGFLLGPNAAITPA